MSDETYPQLKMGDAKDLSGTVAMISFYSTANSTHFPTRRCKPVHVYTLIQAVGSGRGDENWSTLKADTSVPVVPARFPTAWWNPRQRSW
jgi:hypothetical protein